MDCVSAGDVAPAGIRLSRERTFLDNYGGLQLFFGELVVETSFPSSVVTGPSDTDRSLSDSSFLRTTCWRSARSQTVKSLFSHNGLAKV
jgi:hypothetical protein